MIDKMICKTKWTLFSQKDILWRYNLIKLEQVINFILAQKAQSIEHNSESVLLDKKANQSCCSHLKVTKYMTQ